MRKKGTKGCTYSDSGEPCRHCKVKTICRARSLCWTCYYDLSIRALYPSKKNKYTEEGYGLGEENPQRPRPIYAGPGTIAKIEELRKRARKNQPLFPGGDAGWFMNAGIDIEKEKSGH